MAETPTTRLSLLVRLRDPHDENAWTEFMEIYTPLVYQLARKKGFQDSDASDLTQEVFRAVAKAIDRWDPDPSRGSFRGWLFRIARNLMINLLASQKRHPQGTGDTDMARLLEQQPAPDPASEEVVLFEGEYRRRVFAWAAEQVRGDFREATWRAFWLAAVEGRPTQEVAETLGTSVGAVYHHKSRVMARLRQRIEQVEGES
jgi:RNA polymerase sigma-70 factor (ECF subfamily)